MGYKEERKKRLLAYFKKYVEEKGFSLNEERIVDNILEGLIRNEEKFGHIYCPCRPVTGNLEEDRPKICPCVFHLKEIEEKGRCLCGLFVKRDKNEI